MLKTYAIDKNQKGIYGNGTGYVILKIGGIIGKTTRLDEAINLAENYLKKNWDLSEEVRIHEYFTGITWYVELKK